MQLNAPIIIIGAGRSGSTLLDRMLNAHPAIHMLGETNFLVHKLWKSLLDGSEGSIWDSKARFVAQFIKKAGDASQFSQAVVNEHFRDEQVRLGKLILNTIADWFQLTSVDKPLWGMKEIWNGDKETVDWNIYDKVFPNARWVHLVRNPLDYARSAAGWNGTEMTEDHLEIQLKSWSKMVDVSRERKTTGRFVEIRYEDLVEDAEKALAPLFVMLGIPYAPSCSHPLSEYWVATKCLPQLPKVSITELVEKIGLQEKFDEFGYRVTNDDYVRTTSYSTNLVRDANGAIQIGPRFPKGLGQYWTFDFMTAPAILIAMDEYRQRLNQEFDTLLFEDGIPMAVCVNFESFVLSCESSFFSTGTALLLKPSALRDPNINNCKYTIMLVERTK